jgi:hypothetical protein
MPFGTVFLLLLWLCIRTFKAGDADRRRVMASVAGAGALAAVLHLTRNIGVLYGVALLAASWAFVTAPRRRKLALFACAGASAFIVLLPQVLHNYRTWGIVSINSSRSTSVNLLFGTNQQSEGRNNPDDSQYFVQHGAAEANKLALQRIRQAGVGFVGFALGPKFKRMWCDDSYGIASTWHQDVPAIIMDEGEPRAVHEKWERFVWSAQNFSRRFYRGFLVLTLVSLLLPRARSKAHSFYLVSVAAIVASTFLLHLVIEVQPRFHFFLPLVLAPLTGGVLERSPKGATASSRATA